MKSLVIYDSAYGNTAKVARAICDHLGADADLALAIDVDSRDLDGVDLLVVGSPTQGGRATPPVQQFLAELPKLHGVRVAAFDTRIDKGRVNAGLRLLMKAIGFAADKISRNLKSKGGSLAAKPAGFIVTGKEGPLEPAELARAGAWAEAIAAGA
jgi:flavodoxin